MNRLKHTRCYLAGAMDRVPDGGEVWRQKIRQSLNGLGINWLDPTCKPIDIALEDKESRIRRRAAKVRGDYDAVADEMDPIRNIDRRMVNISDFLIVNIDIKVHACGSYDELNLANDQDKPILIHVEQGKVDTPDWLFAMMPHELIFGTWDELIAYLGHIAQDDVIDHLGRWLFFNWMGDSNKERNAPT